MKLYLKSIFSIKKNTFNLTQQKIKQQSCRCGFNFSSEFAIFRSKLRLISSVSAVIWIKSYKNSKHDAWRISKLNQPCSEIHLFAPLQKSIPCQDQIISEIYKRFNSLHKKITKTKLTILIKTKVCAPPQKKNFQTNFQRDWLTWQCNPKTMHPSPLCIRCPSFSNLHPHFSPWDRGEAGVTRSV